MSWNMDIWSQDDTINSGYPFVTDAGIAEKYTHNSEISIWTIQEDKNNGYPFIADTGTAPGYDRTSVKNMWKMKPNVNFGFPYIIDIVEEKTKIFIGTIPVKCIFLGSKQVKIPIFKTE